MRTRVGLAVRGLGASELNWRLMRQARDTPGADFTFFFDDPAPPCLPFPGAAMRLAEGWGYTGPVVACTLAAARRVAAFPGPSARVFYVWDLEWLRVRPLAFRPARAVYADPRLTLVARTGEHASLLQSLWGGRVAGVVPDADVFAVLRAAGAG